MRDTKSGSLSVEEVLDDIGYIYQHIITNGSLSTALVSSSSSAAEIKLMSKIVDKYFCQKYGVRVGQRRAIRIVHGVQQHARMSSRIRWFGILTGFLDAKLYQVDLNDNNASIVSALNITCTLLQTLITPTTNIGNTFKEKNPTINGNILMQKAKDLLPKDKDGDRAVLDLVHNTSTNGKVPIESMLDAILGSYFGLYRKGLDPKKAAASVEATTEELTKAATCIQSSWRGKKSRKQLIAQREKRHNENKAATKIQATWRGKQSRKEIKKGVTTKIDHQDRLIQSLKRSEKKMKTDLERANKERKRWQKAFSKMESKYRSTKRDRKRFEVEAEDLQTRLNVHIKQINDLETELERLKGNGESATDAEKVTELEKVLADKEIVIHDLERQLAGSRASSRWSGTKSIAAQLIAGKKIEDSNKKAKQLEEDLVARVRRLEVELCEEKKKNGLLHKDLEEKIRLQMWLENEQGKTREESKKMEGSLAEANASLSSMKTEKIRLNLQIDQLKTYVRSIWLYGIFRFHYASLQHKKFIKKTKKQIHVDSNKINNLEKAKVDLNALVCEIRNDLSNEVEKTRTLSRELNDANDAQESTTKRLHERIEEVELLNKEVNRFNKEVEDINKKNTNLVETIKDQHLQLQYADERMAKYKQSEEFALIRLKASEMRRMEIEGSFGILARPSNQVANEIMNLSRSLTAKERRSLGGKELNPVTSTVAGVIARERYEHKLYNNQCQSVKTEMLASGQTVANFKTTKSLPSLLPNTASITLNRSVSIYSNGYDSSKAAKDGPVIAAVTCSSQNVRTFWETLRPKHVIELNSVKSALAYFAKPVESVANLPNVVIGEIHLSTTIGQSLLSYLNVLSLPFVLIGTRGHAAKAQLYGATDFVYKPVNAFRLKEAFNLAMNKLARSRKFAIQDIELDSNDSTGIDKKAKEHYESKRRFSRFSLSRGSKSRGSNSRNSNRSTSPTSTNSRNNSRGNPKTKSIPEKNIDFSQIEGGRWKASDDDDEEEEE